MSEIDQQFIEYVVKSLVGKPDAVHIDRRIDEKGVLLELTVDPEDLGRVIGKRGATAQSLRTLLRALGTKNDARYNLKIVDNGSPAPSSRPRQDDNNDNEDRVVPSEEHEEPPKEVNGEEESREQEEKASDVVSKTRQELEELDDLDV